MTDNTSGSKKKFTTDWLVQGALTKIGDSLDRITGRKWIPSSSIATSELIERLKGLLDTEATEIQGKGTVVPHNIKLKIQWDKFSTDSNETLSRLEHELLVAALDHINDSIYYTLAPVKIEVKPDYFTEGVRLFVSFEEFGDEEREAELKVSFPQIDISGTVLEDPRDSERNDFFVARFELNGNRSDRRIKIPPDRRISVGRTSSSDLMIDDISVSKIHASIIVDAKSQLTVADTGSTNGTFVNGERISYGKAIRLFIGDKVKFGVIDVEFEYIPSPPDSTSSIDSPARSSDMTKEDENRAFEARSDTLKVEVENEITNFDLQTNKSSNSDVRLEHENESSE